MKSSLLFIGVLLVFIGLSVPVGGFQSPNPPGLRSLDSKNLPDLRDAPSPNHAPVVAILTATYRQVDNHSHAISTTAIIKKAFESGAPTICLNTREGAAGKDPAPRKKKETLIIYTVDGEKKQIIIPETQTLDFKSDLK